jgi:hypothetical protein
MIFSRTSLSKSIKYGTNYPLVKRIKFVQIKGQAFFKGGDNHRNVRKGWGHLKILFFYYEARKAEFYMKAF